VKKIRSLVFVCLIAFPVAMHARMNRALHYQAIETSDQSCAITASDTRSENDGRFSATTHERTPLEIPGRSGLSKPGRIKRLDTGDCTCTQHGGNLPCGGCNPSNGQQECICECGYQDDECYCQCDLLPIGDRPPCYNSCIHAYDCCMSFCGFGSCD